ncbi:hypothetical protein [Amycolatopsis sp. MEPSY49]|uniref:hypothetical protein n=1 Tax=Amycolatopsis sp. MEPSY49 TaxID=3151600 RepID=UPI003EF53E95
MTGKGGSAVFGGHTMPAQPRRLDPDLPVERFALALRDLHRQAGRPKQRVLATSLHTSHATVSAILNGHRFPSWEQTEALVLACDGDLASWKRRWLQVSREIDSDTTASNAASAQPGLSSPRPLSGGEFYRTMLDEVDRARHRIMTTFLRRRPPAYFLGFTDEETSRAAAAYFEGILAWSDRPGPRSVRRLICTPNAEMQDWAEQFRRETARHMRHEIRVVDWPFATDAVNMAIFDDSVALLAFTAGSAQQLVAFRMDQPDFVRCCVGQFECLWLESRA